MILCDLCGQARECSQKDIEGKVYDICSDCWNPLAEKLKGKGRGKKKEREMAPAEGTGSARIEAVARRTAEDRWRVRLATIDHLDTGDGDDDLVSTQGRQWPFQRRLLPQ
jgi:ribosome-binding protein aMBF1 (putative translation factor)